MRGFPNRPSLSTFGPDAVNIRSVRGDGRELSAQLWNLAKFQLAGLGAVLPLAHLRFSAGEEPEVIARAEAWNPKGLTSGVFTDPGLTRTGVGLYEVVYGPVVDNTGVAVALSFTHGFGFVITPSLATLKHVLVTPLDGTANGVHVAVFDAAGALEDGNDVAIYIG